MLNCRKIAAIAAILAAVLVLIFAVYDSPSYQQCSAETAKNRGYQQHEKTTSNFVGPIIVWRCTGAFIDKNDPAITALATAVIAIFTIVLVFVTNRQAKLTRDGIELARKEFIATHRPKIIIRFIQGPFMDDNGHQFAWISLVNIGDTPATIEEIGHDLATRRKGSNNWLPPGLEAAPKPIVPIVLESGERRVVTVTAKVAYGGTEKYSRMPLILLNCVLSEPSDIATTIGNSEKQDFFESTMTPLKALSPPKTKKTNTKISAATPCRSQR
jgi:hypothetical protein